MEYRKLGRTNINISIIGLGTLHFEYITNTNAVQVLMRSKELGINFIEVGRHYKDSEKKAGFVMKKYRNDFIIASKTAYRKKNNAAKDIEISLQNLNANCIDIYQLHQIDSYSQLDMVLAPGGALEALIQAKNEGKIKYIGITGHSPAVLLKAIKTGEFDTVQILLNVVEREALSELIPAADKMNIGILGMKPFGGGAFLNKDSAIYNILKKYSFSAVHTMLKFSLSLNVTSMLMGVKSPDELNENAAVVDPFTAFTPKQLEEIMNDVDSIGLQNEVFCHRCGYCLCCPNLIDIPLILRLDEYYNKYGSKEWPVYAYKHMHSNASQCTECGKCESKCPFNLPIRKMLKEAHARLSL